MKSVKIIRDPDAFQLMADETRRRIIHLLRAKEMTVSQIASDLGLTAQAIYHHIRKLRKAGLVEVSREERTDHFIETYYRAAAEVFQILHGEGKGAQTEDEMTRDALAGLAALGLDVRTDPESVSKATRIMNRLEDCCGLSKFEAKLAEYDDADFFVKQMMHELASMLLEDDEQLEESFKLQRELKALLMVKGKPEGSAKKQKSR